MGGIEEDLLVRDVESRASGQRLPSPEVSRDAWVRAARDLHTQAMSPAEAVCRRPQVDAQGDDAVRAGGMALWRDAGRAVAHVDGAASWLDIAEAHEEVRVSQAGADVQLGTHRADDLQRSSNTALV